MQQTSPNPHDRWHAGAEMTGAANGSAAVLIRLANDAWGVLPPFTVNVDWVPGMEARDVEAHALAILAQSAPGLQHALIAAGVAKRL